MKSLQEICALKLIFFFSCLKEVKEKIILNDADDACIFFDSQIPGTDHINYFENIPTIVKCCIPFAIIPYIANEMTHFIKTISDDFYIEYEKFLHILNIRHISYEGKINKMTIITDIVRDETFDKSLRIILAIKFFMMKDIVKIWKELTDEEKYFICSEKFKCKYKVSDRYWDHFNSLKILLYALTNYRYTNAKFLKDIFNCILQKNNTLSFIQCWKILGFQTKNALLAGIIDHLVLKLYSECYNNNMFIIKKETFDIFIFLIKTSNKDKLKEIFQNENLKDITLPILTIFLKFPYQDLFIHFLNLVWETITEFFFYKLIHKIADYMNNPRVPNSYDYLTILEKIWKNAPYHYKHFVFHDMESKRIPAHFAYIPPCDTIQRKLSYSFTYENTPIRVSQDYLTFKLFDYENFNIHYAKFLVKFFEDATFHDKEEIRNLHEKHINNDSNSDTISKIEVFKFIFQKEM